jgi:ABC-type nitrate/sulfonate/bicarbonate transport system substrate-binding protein
LSGGPALVAAAWLGASGCSVEPPTPGKGRDPADRVSLKLDGRHGTRFLGFYVADGRGFFAGEGIEVRVEETSSADEGDTAPIRTAAGEFDFAVGSGALLQGQNAGLPLVALAGIYQSGTSTIGESLYTRREYLETRRDLVERFVRASLRGWLWAVENPEEAVDEMLSSYPELVERRDYWMVSFGASIPLIRPPGVAVGSLDCDAWAGRLSPEASSGTEGFCDSSFFERAMEARGE